MCVYLILISEKSSSLVLTQWYFLVHKSKASGMSLFPNNQQDVEYTFLVVDIYQNKYKLNISRTFNEEFSEYSFVIQVGARWSQPCITFLIDHGTQELPKKLRLHGVYYHKDCSYNDLPRGLNGTQSLVLASIDLIKEIIPSLERLSLQDNSTVGGISLIDLSLLQYGKTWYQRFLPVRLSRSMEEEEIKLINRFLSKLNNIVNVPYKEIEGVYGDVYKIWSDCVGLCTWNEFNRRFFSSYKASKENVSQIMLYLANFESMSSQYYVGGIKDWSKKNLVSYEQISYQPFGQSGGGVNVTVTQLRRPLIRVRSGDVGI